MSLIYNYNWRRGRDSNPSYRQAACGFAAFLDQKLTVRGACASRDLLIIACAIRACAQTHRPNTYANGHAELKSTRVSASKSSRTTARPPIRTICAPSAEDDGRSHDLCLFPLPSRIALPGVVGSSAQRIDQTIHDVRGAHEHRLLDRKAVTRDQQIVDPERRPVEVTLDVV